jgi:hypothetical protein
MSLSRSCLSLLSLARRPRSPRRHGGLLDWHTRRRRDRPFDGRPAGPHRRRRRCRQRSHRHRQERGEAPDRRHDRLARPARLRSPPAQLGEHRRRCRARHRARASLPGRSLRVRERHGHGLRDQSRQCRRRLRSRDASDPLEHLAPDQRRRALPCVSGRSLGRRRARQPRGGVRCRHRPRPRRRRAHVASYVSRVRRCEPRHRRGLDALDRSCPGDVADVDRSGRRRDGVTGSFDRRAQLRGTAHHAPRRHARVPLADLLRGDRPRQRSEDVDQPRPGQRDRRRRQCRGRPRVREEPARLRSRRVDVTHHATVDLGLSLPLPGGPASCSGGHDC